MDIGLVFDLLQKEMRRQKSNFIDLNNSKIFYPNIREITEFRLKELIELTEEMHLYAHQLENCITNNIKI